MSNFHFETEFRYIFFKKFLQRRTRPPKFSKLKDALWCLWAIFAKYHIICSLLRIPLDRLAGMPKGAFTALHSTAWACCLSLQHNEEGNGYTESVVEQSIFISKGQLISKGLFSNLNSPKKQTNKFDFTSTIPQVNLFSFIFWKKLKTPKRHFKIN